MDAQLSLDALNDEWRDLATAPIGDWADEPDLAAAADLGAVLGLVRANPDRVLATLLRLGAAGDGLARRVVLQAMLGKAVVLSAGRPGSLPDVIAELWLAIAEYPVDRRPRSIAANLAWAMRRSLVRPPCPPPVDGLDPPAPTPEADATTTLREARRLGLIDADTHRVLWTVYVAGRTSAQAAGELGTTPDVVRWRCSRALRRLARHAELLAEPA
ncbi:RNA polymerase sigma factor [Propionicimonas sp.]|uniref:RNA polymerase sigma factor n=1 Tax=Propionicimonas sp. TaxID=1955623 RepID=UPI0039E2CBA2